METIEPLSKIIATAREAIGWNQSELARAVGVTPQAVQKWEAGTSVPRMKKMVEIAQALGINHQKIVQAYGLLSAEQRLAAKISGKSEDRAELAAGLSADEKRLLRFFRALPEKLRETAIAQIKALADLTSKKVNPVTAEKSGTMEHPTEMGDAGRQTSRAQGVTKAGEKLLDFDEAVEAAKRLAGVEGASRSTETKGKKSNQSG